MNEHMDVIHPKTIERDFVCESQRTNERASKRERKKFCNASTT